MNPRVTRSDLGASRVIVGDIAEIVHPILARNRTSAYALANNPTISTATVDLLCPRKGADLWVVTALATLPLDPDKVRIIAEREKRATTLRTLLRYNDVSIEDQATMCRKASGAVARSIIGLVDPQFRKALAVKAGGCELLDQMAFGDPGQFTDEEVFDHLAEFITGFTKSRLPGGVNAALRYLLGERPGIAEAILDLPAGKLTDIVREALAESPTLTDTVALRLVTPAAHARPFLVARVVRNLRTSLHVLEAIKASYGDANIPATVKSWLADRLSNRIEAVTGPYTDVSDPVILRRLANLVSSPSEARAQPRVLIDLASNPHLDSAARASIASRLIWIRYEVKNANSGQLLQAGVPVSQRMSTAHRTGKGKPPRPEADLLIAKAVDVLGTDAVRWETLLSLIDEYDGDFSSLVDLAARL